MRLRKLLSRSEATRRKTKRRRRALVESLERRNLLATFTVVTGGDAGNGVCSAGQCTLRDAITAANATAGEDTIQFSPAVTNPIVLDAARGELSITQPLQIFGSSTSNTVVSADAAVTPFRVFDMTASATNVTIEGLTITGGRAPDDPGGAIQFQSEGVLTIRDSVITGNTAANGGGIYSLYAGSVVISDSTISGNTALYGAGGGVQVVDGDITVSASLVDGNIALDSGGGLFAQHGGDITVTDSQISNNRTTYSGYNGGGINSGDGNLTITGSTITGNTAEGDGGGIYNYGGAVSISGSNISDNVAAYAGGGILNETGDVTLNQSNLSDNNALYGDGGGLSTISGNVTITRSNISQNRSVDAGGGISTNSGRVVTFESTISGNTTGEDGGGISSSTGLVSLTNTTLSANVSNAEGGGIHSASGPVRLLQSTVTLNQAADAGGGIGVTANDDGEAISIVNSIVAGNTAGQNPDFTAPGNLSNREVVSSLIGDNSGTFLPPSSLGAGSVPLPDARGNLVGGSPRPVIDPMLGPLSFNGGITRTHVPLDGSLAIDAGDNSLAVNPGGDGVPGGGDDAAMTNDQRSFPFVRLADGGSGSVTVDMGAVEVQQAPIFLVDNLSDVVDGDLSEGNRSLREVIALTNASLGADTIQIASHLSGSILLEASNGTLEITDSLSIEGPGADRITITPAVGTQLRLFNVDADDFAISGVTLARGTAATEGGAIRFGGSGKLTVSHSVLRDNRAALGGGIYNDSGDVEIIASTLHRNDGNSHGGGVAALSGTILVHSSTISNNDSSGLGAGVYSVNAQVQILNSTITDNEAGLEGGGVGLIDDDGGETLSIDNSIIAGNSALNHPDFNAPGNPASNLRVRSSLIGDNAGTTLAESNESGGVPQPTADGNLIGGVTGGAIDPLLEPLGDNGGPTPTHALGDGSLAIDSGDATILPADSGDIDNDGDLLETLPTDQRGAVRVVDQLDIGAFEIPPVATITWDQPADIVFGTLLSDTQLNASADGSGTFDYTPAAGTQLSVGNGQVLSVSFTPDDPLTVRPSTATTQINVLKADPVVTWNDPDAIDFGTALSATQLNAIADVAGTFVYDPSSGTVLDAGTGQTLAVTFTPDDTSNYNVVNASVSIDVNRVDPVITWDDPAAIDFGTALSGTQLNAIADVAGTFVYSPVSGTILDAGNAQTLSTTFTPDDTTNYNTVSANVSIDVNKIDPIVAWSLPNPIVFGTALSATQLNAIADVPGTFVYDPAAGTVLDAGDQQISVTFTPDDTTNYNTRVATTTITVEKADPIVTWNNPADIAFGTPLGNEQLNAIANVPGTFVYNPAARTILPAGTGNQLGATFIPDDSGNYNNAIASVLINVEAALDYGDAPSQYPVLLSQDGARHTVGTLRLGSDIDADADGQPSANAGLDSGDDGVTPIADAVADVASSTTSSFLVTSTGDGFVDAFIDFNGDGDWGDAGEQIATNFAVVAGDNLLSYTIPAGATPGDTAARFRLSSAGNLSPTGLAADGEVEDYVVTLLDASAAADVTINLPGAQGDVSFDSGRTSVGDGSVVLFDAPTDSIGQATVVGGSGDNQINLDLGGDGVPASGLSIDGGGGENGVAISGQAALDTTADGNVDAVNVHVVDMATSDDLSSLVIDAAAVAALSPSNNTISVLGGNGDDIDFQDAEDWEMIDPVIEDSLFYNVASNTETGEIVRINAARPWQNPIELSDVNNDGNVTANDALLVINELGRRTFSDDETAQLDDPLTVVVWPGVYYDQSGDGRATALDALRVINRLAVIFNGGAESVQGIVGRLPEAESIADANPLQGPDAAILFNDHAVASFEVNDEQHGIVDAIAIESPSRVSADSVDEVFGNHLDAPLF